MLKPEEILRWLERLRVDSGMVICLKTLEFLRHGRRIGAAKSLIGGLLGLPPTIADKDGNIVPVANARSDTGAYEWAVALVKSKIGQGEPVRLGLVEMGTSGADGALNRLENELRQSFDVVELIRAPATDVIGVHAGPGAWGSSISALETTDPLA